MSAAPVERTFARADIAGSAQIWNRYPELMSAALDRHDGLAAIAVTGTGGEIFKHTGDGFLASFPDVASAVDSMVEYQRSLGEMSRRGPVEIRSRVCIHSGPGEHRRGDWFGPTINHLSRLTDLVAPTHVVLSSTARDELGDARDLDLLGTFPVRDVPGPVSLYSISLADAVGPALTVAAGRGLLQFRTSFVGRDVDVDALSALVDRHRLVTVCGFGGMGKTRLAVEVARRWSERQDVPAYFADLTSADDPMVAIAAAIGTPEGRLGGGASLVDVIAHHLGERTVLLLVDNCEQLITQAAAASDALLDAVPSLRILATSREAMELGGEAVYSLGSLAPDAAVELLQARAVGVGVGRLDDAIARRLCERVERMPLGIELVVGRLRHVGADELADAVDQSFRELRSRRGDGDRHATMSALIAWSYELLGDDERTLLLRLSQLVAPWRRSVVRTLGDELGSEVLDELMAKSLVMPDRDAHLRLLEPVREYCADALAADPGELEAARRALVRWGCDLVPEVTDDRDPVFDAQATRELVDQMPNIRRALAAAIETGSNDQEAEIMVGLWTLVVDGRARRWFGPQAEDTLSRTTEPVRRRALLRLALADTTEFHVDLEREARLLALLVELDPGNTSAEWGFVQSNRAVRQIVVERVLQMDPNPTRQLLEASAEVARSNGRRLDEGLARLFTSFSYLFEGQHRAAFAAAEQASGIVRQVNFAAVAALADAAAALALEGDGEFGVAVEIADAAVPLAEHARWETSVRAVDALLLGRLGRHDDARNQVRAIIDLALAQPVPFLLFDAAIALAAVRTTERDLGGAAEAMDLAGVGRTPLTIAMMFEMAREMEFDLGSDRFVESLDPDAVAVRAGRTATFLRSVSL